MTPMKNSQTSVHMDSGTSLQRYLTTDAAAAYIGMSPSWLNRAKARNEGPVWISLGDKPGSPIRYDLRDLDSWMSNRRSLTITAISGDNQPSESNAKPDTIVRNRKYRRLAGPMSDL